MKIMYIAEIRVKSSGDVFEVGHGDDLANVRKALEDNYVHCTKGEKEACEFWIAGYECHDDLEFAGRNVEQMCSSALVFNRECFSIDFDRLNDTIHDYFYEHAYELGLSKDNIRCRYQVDNFRRVNGSVCCDVKFENDDRLYTAVEDHGFLILQINCFDDLQG